MASVSTVGISNSEWLEIRRQGIGGSDVAAILGISKYKSAMSLWLEKTGMVEPEDISDKESVYWGNVLEDVVAKEFERQTGKKVKRRNAVLFHPQHRHMLANVDRLVIGERAGLECKTAGIRQSDKWDSDEVPDEYYLQCQHYMAVTGFEKWYIAVLIAGQKFVWKTIQRDEEVIRVIIEKTTAFWQMVQEKVMPQVDGSEASSAALKDLLPESNGQEITLPEEADMWIRQYELHKENLKHEEEYVRLAENKLKEMLGANESGRLGERIVSWKSTKGRETFDTKRFKAEHGSLAAQYITTGEPSRRFAIK